MSETLGSLIDKLVTVDMKMWNNQELIYRIRRMSIDEFKSEFQSDEGMQKLFAGLYKCCDLNLQRNELIYEIDRHVETITGKSGYALNPHKSYGGDTKVLIGSEGEVSRNESC